MKHGEKIDIVNLFTAELGNREQPKKFQQAKATLTAPPTCRIRWRSLRRRSRALIAALIIVAALAAARDFTFSHIGPARKRRLLQAHRRQQQW